MAALDNRRAAAAEAGYIDLAHQAEVKHGLPNGLLVGLLEQESGWFPDVISGKRKSSAGAIGIAQFMPATAADEGIDPLNVEQSIDGAADYLARLKTSAGSWSGALTAYNWGIGNYKKFLSGKKKTMPKEAREYAPGVLQRAKNFGTLTNAAATTSAANPAAAGTRESAPVQAAPIIAQPDVSVAPTPTGTALASTEMAPVADTSAPAQPAPTSQQPSTPIQSGPVIPMPDAPGATLSEPLMPATDPMAAPMLPETTLPDFKLQSGYSKEITIDTPTGQQRVQAETEEEAQLITELGITGESNLIQNLPALIQARDDVRSKPMVKTRGDAADKLMRDLIRSV